MKTKMQNTKTKISSLIKLARLHRPFAILLLYLPCLWGLVLGFYSNSVRADLWIVCKYAFILLFGSVISRSMGCVINDILDADFDKKTARCSHRPIASGEISKKQALALFCVLGLLGATSFLFLPLVCIIICLFSLPLICFYPLAKRYFKFPQLVLGLVFNLGVFVGYFCICRTLKLEIFLLYTIAIVWTIIYDTIYAMQDVDDDI